MSQQPKVLITHDQIKQAITKLAAEIRRDYQEKPPLLLGILKGSFVFMADLVRELGLPVEVDFVKVSSYGAGMETSGKVRIMHGPKTKVKGKDVLIVEDIVDTGLTISSLINYLQKKGPASIRLCTLTDKPSRHEVPVTIDYLGFTVPNKFIVGYGIDWNEKFRYLPDICFID